MVLSGYARALVGVLLISAIIGIYLLLVDDVLKSYAPTHAIVLAGFVALDITFVIFILGGERAGILGALGLGVVQFLFMAVDPLTAKVVDPISGKETGGGGGVGEFFLYLYGASDFTVPGRYTFLVLIILQVILIAISLKARRVPPQAPKP